MIEHLKTSMMRALALHIIIQKKENNLYFPGEDGSNQRILWASETATNAESQLSWLTNACENNKTLRALWPHKMWTDARRQARRWNAQEAQLPRTVDYPEPTIQTIGVGGAVTGRHQSCHIFDDLISLKAANSATIMAETIQWFTASRALLDHPINSVQFLIGTRWAVFDLWGDIIKNDPSVDTIVRSIIEEGIPIFPEYFSVETIAQLEKEFGALFSLIYMNSAYDPALVDFDVGAVRNFTMEAGQILFTPDDRDAQLTTAAQKQGFIPPPQEAPQGARLTPDLMRVLFARGERSKMT